MQETEYLVISTATEMVRLREESVVCITSDGNYSHISAIRQLPVGAVCGNGGVGGVMAYKYYEEKKNEWAIALGALALLFQPFVKVALG